MPKGQTDCLFIDIPLISYEKAWALQKRIVSAIHDGRLSSDVFLLLEHPPVYTVGRRGGKENLNVSEDFLEERGIPVVQIERGGNITFHGPGQMVGYPIFSLKKMGVDIPGFTRNLETVMIDTACAFGVTATRNAKNPGVWVDDKKLGSIGMAIRHGISFHGFALNINVDLLPFSWINPCGFSDVRMTTIKNEIKKDVTMADVRRIIKERMADVFSIRLIETDEDALSALSCELKA